ncbi:MAG: FAD-dependent oxidoreductase [Sphingomonas sp.]|uniref:FAD/NAD(P)-binding protein n=1 Tax=Sphingomonas sp. TaxID=28214 RepID=UPI001AD4F901|nr:FAD/NAD(P)-binding protein [Sphingomonas sp.]MBN8807385.1 FAD-dependent oxidoreductase [Sphingomonas sp.]
MIRHVAIVGAGFSGTLQAINLLRHDGPRATLIERAAEPGKGLAYGAAHPSHVLNVRAGNMSALPDDPGHFVRWLTEHGKGDTTSFAERVTYGAYLRDMLDQAIAASGNRLEVRRGDVTDIACDDGGARLTLADGTTLAADAAVLAVGNLPPHDPPGFGGALSPDRYKSDPWDPSVATGLDDGDTVLLIGTGLTMVDIALMLEASGYRGRIVALSRRGLLPRRHDAPAPGPGLPERPTESPADLLRRVRARGEAIGWRAAVDELRPYTQAMWANASEAERERFLRHLRPWWDVHRHRLAPQVADRLEAMRDRGQLEAVAGKTIAAEETPDGIAVTWRRRGSETVERTMFRRIVNCTGPQGDLTRTTEPLLATLRDRGVIRADPARLGIDVDGCARTIAADGLPNERLYALGPMTRGAFWEIVAVPDIRQQTWNLARRLSNAQWVGGEGL